MDPYHKIQSIWKRHSEGEHKGCFKPWEWSTPELEYLQDLPWRWTEKVDGTNIRILLTDVSYTVMGRTDRATIPAHLMDAIKRLDLPKVDEPMTLYGEGYGPKIQSGGKYREDAGFVLFDVRVGDWWLKPEDVQLVADDLHLDVTPFKGIGTIADAIKDASKGFNSQWGDFEAEGLVGTPFVPLYTRRGDRVICKVKTKDFRKLDAKGIDYTKPPTTKD